MEILEELEKFNWDTKNIEEIETMIFKIEDEEETEELNNYLEYLKEIKRDIENYQEDVECNIIDMEE